MDGPTVFTDGDNVVCPQLYSHFLSLLQFGTVFVVFGPNFRLF